MDELFKAAIFFLFWGGVIYIISKIVSTVRRSSRQREEANRKLEEISRKLR